MSFSKIVYCIPSTYGMGGMERVLTNKVNYLASFGFDVCIITTDQQGKKPYFTLDERVKCYDLSINYQLNRNRPFFKKAYWFLKNQKKHKEKLGELLTQLQPDIVVSLFGNDSGLLSRLKIPAKKILEFHFCYNYFFYTRRQGILNIIDKFSFRNYIKMIKRYDRFVVLTDEDKAYWNELDNVIAIPNARTFKTTKPSSLDTPKVIAVGRYVEQKAFDRLIKAWSIIHNQVKGWSLHIIGDGQLKGVYQQMIRELNLGESVKLHRTEDIKNEYMTSSLLVMSSISEGLPMVAIESMSCGVPVISFTFPCGPRDLISNGENGILVSDGDIPGLAKKILYLIQNPDERKRLGANAYSRSEDFSEEKIMKMWINLFETLAESKDE